MDGGDLVCALIGGLLFGGAGLFLFYLAVDEWKKIKLVKETPTSKVSAVVPGLVEVKGYVDIPDEERDDIFSPIYQEECVYYKTKVQERISGGGRRRRRKWKTFWEREFKTKFLLTDRTGTIVVDPEKADFDLGSKKMVRQGIFAKDVDKVKRFAKREKIDTKSLFGLNRELRYIEKFIPLGARVYVLGNAKEVPIDDDIERDWEVEPCTIMKDGKKGILHIADMGEKAVINSLRKSMIWFIVFGSLCMSPFLLLIFALIYNAVLG
jgi:hypothetical protein